MRTGPSRRAPGAARRTFGPLALGLLFLALGPTGGTARPSPGDDVAPWPFCPSGEGSCQELRVAAAGDSNGDGFDDVIVSLPGDPGGRAAVGKAYLYLGTPAGVSGTPAATILGDLPGGRLGEFVRAAGDVDGDGRDDAVIVSPSRDGAAEAEGRAALYLGSAEGLSASPAWVFDTAQELALLGPPAPADLDGDGRTDLAVGSPFFDVGGEQDSGRVWIFQGAEDPSSPFAEVPVALDGRDLGTHRFGILGVPGDFDADGRADLVVTSELVASPSGRVFVLLGGRASAPIVLSPPVSGVWFGLGAGSVGDVDGDGHADLLVRAPACDPDLGGWAGLWLGSASGIDAQPAWTRSGPRGFPGVARLGDLAISAGDFDGDGRSDALLPELELDGPSGSGGYLRIFLGRPEGLGPSPDLEVGKIPPGHWLRSAAAFAGDSDGDGLDDVVRVGPSEVDGEELSIVTIFGSRGGPAVVPPEDVACAVVSGAVEIRWTCPILYDRIEILRDGELVDALPGSETEYVDRAALPGDRAFEVVGVLGGDAAAAPPCGAYVDEVRELSSGGVEEVVLTPTRSRALFTFAARSGRAIEVELEDDDPAHSNALYARWGEPPTEARFDDAAHERGLASQRLVLPAARTEVLWILVQGNILLDGEIRRVRLTLAESRGVALEGISTRRAGLGTPPVLGAVVTGAGFVANRTEFSIERPATEAGDDPIAVPAASTLVTSPDRAEVVFDLSGLDAGAAGLYDLKVAVDGSAEAVLPAALELTEALLGPAIQARISGPGVNRPGRQLTLTLSYANLGDLEASAPFLVIEPLAPSTELRLAGEEEFREGPLQIVGTSRAGLADRLEPGEKVEVPIVLRSSACLDGCDVAVRVSMLTPGRGDFVRWDEQPSPDPRVPEEAWDALWPALSSLVGPSWLDYRAAMVARALRLARRGDPALRTDDLFHLAAMEAAGRPTAACRGRVLEADGATPVAGGTVVAILDGSVVSAAVTGPGGDFLLRGLEEGGSYDLELSGRELVAGPVSVRLAAGLDLLGVELLAGDGPGPSFAPACPGCDDDLPRRGLRAPPDLLTPVAEWTVRLLGAIDPNEKNGTAGPDDLVTGRPVVHYQVSFENMSSASLPAQTVRLSDPLQTQLLDLETVQLRDVVIGQDGLRKRLVVDTPAYGSSDAISVEVPKVSADGVLVPGETELLPVDVETSLDQASGTLRWEIRARTDNLFSGVLWPNDGTGRGQGHVTFSVSPRQGAPGDLEIENRGSIEFDELPAIQTNVVRIPVGDLFALQAPASPQPRDDPGFASPVSTVAILCWAIARRADSYDVRLWKAGEAPGEPVVRGTTQTCIRPPAGLEPGTTYLWQVTANRESESLDGPVWSFVTEGAASGLPPAPSVPSPADGDLGTPLDAVLGWKADPRTAVYAVRFWKEGSTPPSSPGIDGIAGNQIGSGGLQPRTAYLWQVIARNASGSTPGPIWRFSTSRPFARGDTNADGKQDLSDAVFVLNFLFLGGEAPGCESAADSNDSGRVDISDAVWILNFFFLGGDPIAPPYPACGDDPTPDDLTCESSPACP